MKKLLIATLVVSAAAVAVESSAGPKADDAIKRVFVQLDRCLGMNDAQCVADLFAEDGTFSEPTSGARIIKGKAQIVMTLQDLMGAPNMKGAKQTHTVQNVRMLSEDHAVVDSSLAIAGVKPAEGATAGTSQAAAHAFTVLVRKEGKWLFEDTRSYIVGTASPTNTETAPAAKEASPPAKQEPTQRKK